MLQLTARDKYLMLFILVAFSFQFATVIIFFQFSFIMFPGTRRDFQRRLSRRAAAPKRVTADECFLR